VLISNPASTRRQLSTQQLSNSAQWVSGPSYGVRWRAACWICAACLWHCIALLWNSTITCLR